MAGGGRGAAGRGGTRFRCWRAGGGCAPALAERAGCAGARALPQQVPPTPWCLHMPPLQSLPPYGACFLVSISFVVLLRLYGLLRSVSLYPSCKARASEETAIAAQASMFCNAAELTKHYQARGLSGQNVLWGSA